MITIGLSSAQITFPLIDTSRYSKVGNFSSVLTPVFTFTRAAIE